MPKKSAQKGRSMRPSQLAVGAIAGIAVIVGLALPASAQLMIIGNDQKPKFDNGVITMQPPGKDSLSVVDIAKPAEPHIIATIPLDNTIVGPPTNLAITPKGDLALVANPLKAIEKDGK